MSLEALNRAWKSPQPGTKKLLLLALANVADEWGYAYAGGEYLAKVCNISLRSVRRGLKDLQLAEEIRLVFRGGGRTFKDKTGQQGGEANVYQVIIGLTPEEVTESEKLSKLACNGDKMTPFNGDKMSPHTLNLNTAAVFNSRRAAAANKGDKMTPLAKIGHETSNGDKMSLLLEMLPETAPPNASEVVQVALEAWSGSLEELALLLGKAQFKHSYGLQEALDDARGMGWRGSLDDVVKAWLENPDRIENLIWYGRQKGWGGGLLRKALQSGEWPPELKPDSPAALEAERARYLNDPYRAFYENMEDADV